MKNKNLILISTTVLVLAASIMFSLNNKNNKTNKNENENSNESSNVEEKKDLVINKVIEIDEEKYGNLYDFSNNYILLKKDNKYYIYDYEFNLINSSKEDINLNLASLKDEYYIIDKKLFNKDKMLFEFKNNVYIKNIYNDYIEIEDDNRDILLFNLKNNNIIDSKRVLYTSNTYRIIENNNRIVVYQNNFDDYKEYKKSETIGYHLLKISSDNDYLYIDLLNNIVFKDEIKFNSNHILTYDGVCFTLYDDTKEKVLDNCFKNYRIITDKVFEVYDENDHYLVSNASYIKIDKGYSFDKVGEYVKASDYSKNISKIYNDSLEEVNICKGNLEYIKDDIYYCVNGVYRNFVIDKKVEDTKYKNIICNEAGFCAVEKNRSYNLYYKNKQIIDKDFNLVSVYDKTILIKYNKKTYILELDFKNEENSKLDYNKLIKDEEINIDLDKIIKEHKLEEYRDDIYNNKELSKRFFAILEKNKIYGIYEDNMYNYIKVVLKQKANINDSFFRFLDEFKVEFKNQQAAYYFGENTIRLPAIDGLSRFFYHEVMHFFDYNFSEHGIDNSIITCNGKKYLAKNYNSSTDGCYIKDVDDEYRVFVEGGADFQIGRYFYDDLYHGYDIGTYIYIVLEYILGQEELDKAFFGNSDIVNVLNKYSNFLDIDKFLMSADKISIHYNNELHENSNLRYDEALYNVFEYLIDLYEVKFNKSFKDDEIFGLLMYNIRNSYYQTELDRNNNFYKETLVYENEYNKIINNVLNDINARYKNSRDSRLSYVYIKDNKLYAYARTFINYNARNFKYEIDINTKKVKFLGERKI